MVTSANLMERAVKMLAFAGARDVIGASETAFSLDAPCTAGDFLLAVFARFPALAPYKGSIRLAVNGTYADATDPVSFGDEVALIPPVAGG